MRWMSAGSCRTSRKWPTTTRSCCTSQDADVRFGDDGDYWTWTIDELREALPEKAFHVARGTFDVEEAGEMHHNPRKNVLWWKRDPAGDDEWPVLKDALGRLKAA